MKLKHFLLLGVLGYLTLGFAACSKTTPPEQPTICPMPFFDSSTAIIPTKK